MLTLYFHSILITIFFTPFGLFFLKDKVFDLSFYSSQLIFGSIVLSFSALLLNFFLPLDIKLNTLFIIISLYILIKNREIYLNKNFIFFTLTASLIIALLITESNIYKPDAGLYHLPYINILNHEKIIFGLTNLHFRFGHVSIIQYLSALSNNLIFGINGIVFAPALIATAVIINFTSILIKKIKLNLFDVHFFFLLGVFIFIFYKMNRYSGYGNDATSHFLFYYLFSQIILLINKINIQQLSNTFLISAFIFMNKITLSIATIIPLIFLNKKIIIEFFKYKRTYFIITFFILWVVKNIIISGCAIYPVSQTCFKNLLWVDIKTVKYVSNENEAWTKNWPDSDMSLNHSEYIKNFSWLKDWKKNYLPKIFKKLFPFIFVLVLLGFFLFYNSKKNRLFLSSYKINIIYIVLTISVLIWFLKIPLLRYGQSFIITLICIIFATFCGKLKIEKKYKKIFTSIIIFGTIVFVSKNILRISKNNNNYINYPWPKYLGNNEKNKAKKNKKIIINGKEFYKSGKGGICMYSLPLCSGMERIFEAKFVNNYLFLFRK